MRPFPPPPWPGLFTGVALLTVSLRYQHRRITPVVLISLLQDGSRENAELT
jgi:hypothetical protein